MVFSVPDHLLHAEVELPKADTVEGAIERMNHCLKLAYPLYHIGTYQKNYEVRKKHLYEIVKETASASKNQEAQFIEIAKKVSLNLKNKPQVLHKDHTSYVQPIDFSAHIDQATEDFMNTYFNFMKAEEEVYGADAIYVWTKRKRKLVKGSGIVEIFPQQNRVGKVTGVLLQGADGDLTLLRSDSAKYIKACYDHERRPHSYLVEETTQMN